MKLCREQGYSIQAVLWAAHRNLEHRMKHWITLLSIANTRCDTTSGKASKGSGKSSRGQLALLDSTALPSNKGKGGRTKGDKDNKSGVHLGSRRPRSHRNNHFCEFFSSCNQSGTLIQDMRNLSGSSRWRNSELGALALRRMRSRNPSEATFVIITGRSIRGDRV